MQPILRSLGALILAPICASVPRAGSRAVERAMAAVVVREGTAETTAAVGSTISDLSWCTTPDQQ